MICKKCGKEIKDDVSFCDQCGEKLTDSLGVKVKKIINSIGKDNKKNKFLVIASIICVLALSGAIGTINHIRDKKDKKVVDRILKDTIDFDEKNNKVKDVTASDKNINTNTTDVEKNDIVSKVNFSINQVDSSNFPNVDVYFSATSNENKDISELTKDDIIVKENQNSNMEVTDLKRTSEIGLDMNLVVQDTIKSEGSDSPLKGIKEVLRKYLDTINFNGGDKIALTSFNRGAIFHPSYFNIVHQNYFGDEEHQYVKEMFLSDKEMLISKINKLGSKSEDVKYIYDALYMSLIETNKQSGQKCIIAIVSGKNSGGLRNSDDVIDLSKKLNIPINIISVGIDDVELNNVVTKTGGQYIHIDKNSSTDSMLLSKLESIYKEYKNQYVISAKMANDYVDGNYRDISIEGKGDITGIKSIRYIPKFIADAKVNSTSLQYNISEPEKAVHDHIYSLTKGLRTIDGSNQENNIDNMDPYLYKSSQLYSKMGDEVIRYKNVGLKGEVYYTIENVYKDDENRYTVKVIERLLESWALLGTTKYVDNTVTYTVSNTPDGWRVTDKNIESYKEALCNYDTIIK